MGRANQGEVVEGVFAERKGRWSADEVIELSTVSVRPLIFSIRKRKSSAKWI